MAEKPKSTGGTKTGVVIKPGRPDTIHKQGGQGGKIEKRHDESSAPNRGSGTGGRDSSGGKEGGGTKSK